MEYLAIIALVYVAYRRTVDFGLIVDDHRHALMVKEGLFKGFNLFETIRRRLYGVGTLAINGNINTKHEHALSIAIHALICVLIYKSFGSSQVSFLASLLYAINPANNQTSIWLNGRRYAINTVLVLLMLWAGPVGLVLYPLTAFLQVSAFFAPIMYGPLSIIALGVFWLISGKDIQEKVKMRKDMIFNSDHRDFAPKKLIVITKIYGLYCLRMVLPGRTMMIYPNLFYWGMTSEGNKDAYALNKDFAVGVISVVLTVLGGIMLAPTKLFWPYVFMVLATAQNCGIITVTQQLADRYISLPNAFMMFFVSYFLNTYLQAFAIPVITLLLGYYWANLKISMLMYPNLNAFWDYHLFFNPANPKCREFKATALLKRNDPLGAWEVIKEGLKYNPTDFKMNLLAASCMKVMDDKKAVLMYLKLAKQYCYIGFDHIYKGFEKDIFGFDLETEMQAIRNKESKFKPEQRKNIETIYQMVNA